MGAGQVLGGHDHGAGRALDRSRLKLVLAISLLIIVVEVVGAWLSNSLALLADAGHVVTDAAAVVLALSASYVATLPATPRRTFGFHRAEILAALANAVLLVGVCGYLAFEGVRRLVHPASIEARPMLVFALIGLVANAGAMLLLNRRRDSSLNMRAAYLEVLTDLIGSALVVLAAVVVLAGGSLRVDPVASLVIAALIVPRAFILVRDAVNVLLETTPAHLNLDDVRDHLGHMDGVVDVHDLHAWTITSGLPVLSAHVTVTEEALATRGVGRLLDELSSCVADHFEVEHATFQIEPASHQEHEDLGDAHT